MKGIHYVLYHIRLLYYRSFTTIFHKCLILLLVFILHLPIMLSLCLMFSMTCYAQNYAGIIGGSLVTGTPRITDYRLILCCYLCTLSMLANSLPELQ